MFLVHSWMRILKKHIIAAAALCTLASGAAFAQQAAKAEGPWLVRARAVYVDTYNSTSGQLVDKTQARAGLSPADTTV
jgi:outer membrane protein W